MPKETPRSPKKRGVSASGGKAPAGDAAARALLEAAIDKYDPKIAALGRKALGIMRKRLPGALEMVYDNYNALGVGFAGIEKAGKIPLSIVFYPRWITLFFLKGSALPDPEHRLEGKGSTVRSIRIETAKALTETFGDEYVDRLITAAVMHAGWTLDPRGKSRVIIRFVSPKQRPRRA
ncbi:MAG TPA: hypothetical protein VGO52_21280 [Hyphomonadaceae bacterium]|jgi:hypothetical protein|nr:hypothetical protein [Hyphomonadaceae bacterium]